MNSSAIDISGNRELLQLAEEVDASGKPVLLRKGRKDIALIAPIHRRAARKRGGPKKPAELDAFRSAAGGWADIDTDKLVKDIYESRRSSRPAVEL